MVTENKYMYTGTFIYYHIQAENILFAINILVKSTSNVMLLF